MIARRAGAIILGLVIAGTLAAIDTSEPPHSIVIGTVVLAPFIVSTIAGPRETAFVGAVAFLLAVASGFWNDNFETGAYYLRAAVVLVGSGISVLAASARRRTVRDQARFALLADLADVADGRLTLDETADRVCALVVPGFADLCVIDVVHQDGLRRLAVRFAGADTAEQEAGLRARDPTRPGQPGSGETVETGSPELLENVTDDVLCAAAHDEADLALLRSVRYRSMIIVPLSARGRTLGALSLAVTERSGRRYVPEDLRFVEVLSGRVALALDNAGLFTELQTMEAQLTAVLGSLTEAVTVRGAPGRADLRQPGRRGAARLRLAAGAAGHAGPRDRRRYTSFREDGSPLDLGDVPGARLLAGRGARAARPAGRRPRDGRAGVAADQVLRGARQRRRDHDGGQRHRRHHRRQARRARPAAARRGRGGARDLRGDAPARGRAVRPRARRLVRDQRPRRPRAPPDGGRRPLRP